jgi:hypothetical protein
VKRSCWNCFSSLGMEYSGFALLGYGIVIAQGAALGWIALLDGAFAYRFIRFVALLAFRHTEDTMGIGVMDFDHFKCTTSSREGIATK